MLLQELSKLIPRGRINESVQPPADILEKLGQQYGTVYGTTSHPTMTGWSLVKNSTLGSDERSDKGVEEKYAIMTALKKAGHQAKMTGTKFNQVMFKAARPVQESATEFFATDVSHEPDGVMVLVKSDSEADDYHGVNVVFDEKGKVQDLVTADPVADQEKKDFRSKIISAARKELNKHERTTKTADTAE